MAGTISFGGIGSGIDTEAIVSGLISASRAGLSPLKSRSAATKAAVSSISSISSLLSKLKTATEALDTARELGGFKATSSGDAVVARAQGNATPGRFQVEVSQLASEQRSYSSTFASSEDDLNLDTSLGITIGDGPTHDVEIVETDSLTDIARKINDLDARVSASVVFDGSNYRLRVQGVDSGAANAITFSGGGAGASQLDINGVHNATMGSPALDAQFSIDGIAMTRSTNEVVGAVPGLTLSLNAKTSEALTIGVETDPASLQKKLEEFVSAYNAVVQRVQTEAGFGQQKGSNPVLSGDSTLRAVSNRLANGVLSHLGGDYGQTLASVGVRLNNNGTLRLDASELSEALTTDSGRVARVLAGDGAQDGIMDMMRDLVDGFTKSGTGLLATKRETLEERAGSLDKRIEREEARLTVQAELLRKQFTAMDQSVSANRATLDYLIRMSVG